MRKSFEEIREESQRVLDIIEKEKLTNAEKKDYIKETTDNFAKYFNPGFLEYRKSASTDYTSVEWTDHGDTFEDINGKEFIDCLGGYGIYNVGHRHPKVVKAVQNQLKRQALHSQELLDPLRGNLGKILAGMLPGDLQYCFFTNSGTETVECALKVAMLATDRHTFICATGAFHGKSLGSLSGTSKTVFRKPFLPLVQGFRHIPFNDIDYLEKTLEACKFTGEDAAAVLLEPIQGEGGVIIPDDDYFPKVRELCDKYGALLIADEVQTGMGRTGKICCLDHWNVTPDLICLAKAIGGGVMPLGACVGTEKVWQNMMPNPFIHTTTFGGNPLACAAGIATINVIMEENLCERSQKMGKIFVEKLQNVVKNYPNIVTEARGKGLMIALEFVDDEKGYQVASGLFDKGILVAGTLINAKTIRIEPPLTISMEHIDQVVTSLNEVLKNMKLAKKEAAAAKA